MKKFTAIFLIVLQLLSHFHEAYAVTRLRTAVLSEAEAEAEAKTETETETETKVDLDTILDLGKSCLKSFVEVIPPDFCWKQNSGYELPKECPANYRRSPSDVCIENCRSGFDAVNPDSRLCYEKCPSDMDDKGTDCSFRQFYGIVPKNFYRAKRSWWFWGKACKAPKKLLYGACYNDCTDFGMVNCGPLGCASTNGGCNSAIATMTLDVLFGVVKVAISIATSGISALIKPIKEGFKALVNSSGVQILQKIADNLKEKFMKSEFVEFLKDSAAGKAFKALGKLGDKVLETAVTGVCKRIYDKILTGAKLFKAPTLDEAIASVDIFDVKDLAENCHNPPEPTLTAQEKENRRAKCLQIFLDKLGGFDPTGILSVASTFVQPKCMAL